MQRQRLTHRNNLKRFQQNNQMHLRQRCMEVTCMKQSRVRVQRRMARQVR